MPSATPKKIGIGKSNAALALKQLVERGFLEVKRDSAFNVKTKEARTWILTAEPMAGEPPTREFMRWSVSSSQSDPPDRRPEVKSKTRSAIVDTQSNPPDCDGENETILPVSVRAAGPTEASLPGSQSGGWDTYNIPSGSVANFGDAAKAQHDPAVARGVVPINEVNGAAR